MSNLFIGLGSVGALIGVAAGAFGAHGLKSLLDAGALATWHTAVDYLFIHALALLWLGAIQRLAPRTAHRSAGSFMVAGIVVFCGSLFLLSLTGTRWLGAITPIGGVCFLIAWFILAISYLRPGAGAGH